MVDADHREGYTDQGLADSAVITRGSKDAAGCKFEHREIMHY